jgi:hypothetical protein
MATMTKKKCRQYSIEYLAHGFIPSPQDKWMPLCLICMSTLSDESMRPCKLRLHLETIHKDKKDKSLDYFKKLRDNFQTRPTVKQMFNERAPTVDKGLLASYEISELTAKPGKPHNIGESLILPAVSVVISTVKNQSVHKITDHPFEQLVSIEAY